MKWDAIDEQRVALALAIARDGLSDKAAGSNIVMQVIKAIVDIDHRTNDVRGYCHTPLRAFWVPYNHSDLTKEERLRIIRLHEKEIEGRDGRATSEEEEIADAVKRVFRSCLVGKNQIDDWKLLFAFAKGMSSREVGPEFKITYNRALDYRKKQLDAIWTQVSRLMPAPRARAA